MTSWLSRFRQRFRGSLDTTGTAVLPAPTEQHAEKTVEQRFKEEHGYSQASEPERWTEDISKHNAAVQQEYSYEIESRKAAFVLGDYVPRFFERMLTDDENAHYAEKTVEGAQVRAGLVAEVNWDLELTLRPGARVDVTETDGVVKQPLVSDVAQARAHGELGREVASLEREEARAHVAALGPKSVRDVIGTRAMILKATNGNEALANQAEAKAREVFGVDDLDAPYGGPNDDPEFIAAVLESKGEDYSDETQG